MRAAIEVETLVSREAYSAANDPCVLECTARIRGRGAGPLVVLALLAALVGMVCLARRVGDLSKNALSTMQTALQQPCLPWHRFLAHPEGTEMPNVCPR